MKELIYVYPGRFCPPTYGHFNIIKRSADIFPKVVVICSTNPDKKNDIFKPEESKTLWRAYNLPNNVDVQTFSEFTGKKIDSSRVVIIRGIRNYADIRDEEKVISLNKEKFGIDKYFYLVSEDGLENISASKTRKLAEDMELEKLSKYISPLIISKLLERTLGLKNIFMVVGKPGSGKSTFLKILTEENQLNAHINTDQFNKKVRPLLEKAFGKKNLIKMAINQKEKFQEIIREPWIKLLKESLRMQPPKSNVFVEIPYGLQPDKLMFRFIGGRIIYIGCNDESLYKQRLLKKNKPHVAPFIKTIPGLDESAQIAKKYKLELRSIMTDGSLESLKLKAKQFNESLK